MIHESIFDRLRRGIVTTSATETQQIAAEFGKALPPDCMLALHGDLGAGKTTFVQGLARGLGIDAAVTSPTFNIYTVYTGVSRTLVHLDAYRLDDALQMETLLLEDFLVSPWVIAIEWPEKISSWIPASAYHLELGITADENHTIAMR